MLVVEGSTPRRSVVSTALVARRTGVAGRVSGSGGDLRSQPDREVPFAVILAILAVDLVAHRRAHVFGARGVVTGLGDITATGAPIALGDLTLIQERLQGSLFGESNPRHDIPPCAGVAVRVCLRRRPERNINRRRSGGAAGGLRVSATPGG